jgi:hypothetical protein
VSDLAPSAAHNLGALTGGLALIAEELAARLHTTHARPGESWRDCQANSRACRHCSVQGASRAGRSCCRVLGRYPGGIMSHRMHARPRRVRRWQGRVEEVFPPPFKSFWCSLVPVDHSGPELVAEMALSSLPAAEPGMVFTVYVHRRGRKVRTVVRERDLGVWTQEEIDGARARAKELVSLFGAPEVDR